MSLKPGLNSHRYHFVTLIDSGYLELTSNQEAETNRCREFHDPIGPRFHISSKNCSYFIYRTIVILGQCTERSMYDKNRQIFD